MRLIDIDDDRNCYIGLDGEYEKWNIDPDVLTEAKTVEPQQWIPVSSGLLPKAECGEGEDVLCQLENMRRIVLYFDGDNWCYPSSEPYIGVNYENGWSNKVVAWRELPEPWEGSDNED